MPDVQIRTDCKTRFALEFSSLYDLQQAIGAMKTISKSWNFLSDPGPAPASSQHPWGIPNRGRP